MGVMTRLEDLTVVLSQTQDHRSRVLAATSRNLRTWQIKVKKIKAIYHTMNMFNNDVARKCLIAECWAPVTELDRIQLALRKGSVSHFSFFKNFLNIKSVVNLFRKQVVVEQYHQY